MGEYYWEKRELAEIVNINSGRDYKHLKEGNIPVYGTGGYLLSVNEKLSDKDAIGIGRKGTIDKPQLLNAPFWTVDTLFYMVPITDNNILFCYYISNRIKWGKFNESTGVPSLSKSSISKISIMLPNSKEQIKIGGLLRQLDSTIALHQRKLEKLNQIKQAYLQQLFPQNGESVPRLRFSGFGDEWEKRKVKGFSENTYGGGTPRTSVEEYWNGYIPWIQSSDLTEHQVSGVVSIKKITEKGLKESATKLIPENSIAIVTRVGVGKLALMQSSYTTSQDFLSLGKLTVNKWFGVYSLYKLLQKEVHNVQGTSIKGITKDELLSKQIYTPKKIEEQAKIGSFFKHLDNTIALHQNKLDKLQNFKKAYLQKLFI